MKLDYLSQKKAFVVVCEKDDEQDVVKQIVYNRKNVYYVNNKGISKNPCTERVRSGIIDI